MGQYEKLYNFKNLYQAYKLAHRGKINNKEVIEFDKHKIENLRRLQKQIQNKEWDKIFTYYRFTITDPKIRIVDALHFEGRIIQHILCDLILKPWFEPRLVKENCACRIDKGTDYAIKILCQHMTKILKYEENPYVLKIDIKKFFPSIDRDTLKNILSKFPDKEVLELLYFIIDSAPEDKGIPIGNQTSQWFALYYLNELDRTIKEKHSIKFYVRYMDDLIILDKDKKDLQVLLLELKIKAQKKYKLNFNSKTQITPIRHGISFLGWKIFPVENNKLIQILSNNKKRHKKKKIKEMFNNFKTQKDSQQKFNERYVSTQAHLNKGNTYGFQKQYLI